MRDLPEDDSFIIVSISIKAILTSDLLIVDKNIKKKVIKINFI
jgi:hypothetical protein